MKTYIYNVNCREFQDDEPFGKAWRAAKAYATEVHQPIYRKVVEIHNEVFLECGAFIGTKHANPDSIKVF